MLFRSRLDGSASRIAGIFINIDAEKKEAMQAQKSAAFHRAFTKADLCEYYVNLEANTFDTFKVEPSLMTVFEQSRTWDELIRCGFAEEEPDLGRLAIHLLLTASTRTMRQEYLAGLDSLISIPHQAYCYDFISEWLHSEDKQQLYDVARYVEDEARLHQRFEKLKIGRAHV